MKPTEDGFLTAAEILKAEGVKAGSMNPIAAIPTKGFDLVDTNTDAKISRGEDTAAN